MKKKFGKVICITAILFSSCIYFETIDQPSIGAPNETFIVSIHTTTEGGDKTPYFGVCLPIGWTIPGDSVQCSGVYNETIYYDSLVSFEQEYFSPAPVGYYWWAGKGIPDSLAIGNVYAELQIQTDSQIGSFSIDYMLGDSYWGVNHQRSNDHLIEITDELPHIASVVPNVGYQNFLMDINIQGSNTHFLDGLGTENVWLSQNEDTIYANVFVVTSNTSLDANFYIPLTAPLGLWDVNVETDIDGVITKENGFEIFPPIPAIIVSPNLLNIEVLQGNIGTEILTITNTGWNDLHFDISPYSYSLQFDGVDDYTQIPAISPITNIPLNQFTFEGWILFSSLSSNPQQFIEGLTPYYEIFFETDENTFGMRFNITDDTGLRYEIKTRSLVENQWYHIAGTYDGLIQRIFLNGVLEDSISWNNTFTIITGFSLGKDYESNVHYLNGSIDEVRIWNIARTQEEIMANMYKELGGSENGLVGYWQFNEAVGDTAFDKTINGNHCSLQNGVSWIESTAPIPSNWLSASPDSGVCFPFTSMDITVSFDATELEAGDYYSNLTLKNNDPFHPQVIIPAHMNVEAIVGIEDEFTLPTDFSLYQNFPNPYNPSTKIKYSIAQSSNVVIKVFDILGNEIETLVNEEKPTGTYEITWNAANLPSGIYFYRLQAGSFVETMKMILLK